MWGHDFRFWAASRARGISETVSGALASVAKHFAVLVLLAFNRDETVFPHASTFLFRIDDVNVIDNLSLDRRDPDCQLATALEQKLQGGTSLLQERLFAQRLAWPSPP